jgi:hypothetical protein
MSRPRLPSRASEAWACSFLFDSPRDVAAVSSRGGLVVAGGEELHVVRPGAENMSSRVPPLDIGRVLVAAAEPRAPWRYAIASAELVAVFFRSASGEQIVRLRPAPAGLVATHLAWGRADGASALHVRWDDGAIVRMKQDMSGVDTTDLPPMDALASDAEGVLAMVSFAGPEPCAFVTRDGETLVSRPLPSLAPIARTQRVHLAVAGAAVAFAIDRDGAFVSRADDAPFVASAELASAGPLEFEGTTSDAPLLGVLHGGGVATLVSVLPDGTALCIAEVQSEAGVTPEVTALSWDASRRTLWGASPQMGLVTCVAPDAKGAKKHLMS